MLSMQEMSDRMEIEDLFKKYSYSIDLQNWDELDEIFTEDSIIDYTEMGGPSGRRDEMKKFLAEVMPKFMPYQHLVAGSLIKIDGDRATSRSMLINPMTIEQDGKTWQFFVGLWYHDDLIRTADRWWITRRHTKKCYNFYAPPGLIPS